MSAAAEQRGDTGKKMQILLARNDTFLRAEALLNRRNVRTAIESCLTMPQ